MSGHLRWLALPLLAAAVASGNSAVAGAQARPDRTVPRAPDGHPDLQGVWTNATLTPLERPHALADKPFFTEEEARNLEAQAAGRQAAADDPKARAQALERGDIGSYNQFWFDSGTTILPTRQTSLVVDPPDGRVPLRPQAEARRDEALKRSTDHPEFMSLWDQCISRGVPGWIIPAGYNNAYQIVQTKDFVVIHSEMIHDARMIPLDGRPPLPTSVQLLEGDSRGRWEGDTLVVETKNFADRNWIATSAAAGRIKGIPQSTALRIVERFTRVSPDRIDYEARVEDPEIFTRPWTLAFPLTRDDEYRIYEYACHEGNSAVEGILRGARYQERQPGPRR
ncbi:MAG TPA: hypothetical protein VL263_00610 [Vicinamibacterales bacterium]|nr:hypothetical protein [Vicinamibacterales bacterium]